MTDLVTGTFTAAPTAETVARLRTQRIGLMSFDIEAPVTAGHLQLAATSSELELSLDLTELRVGNPLMQAAARALVGSGENSRLTFDAMGSDDDRLRFTGTARAGDVQVPMEVTASLAEADDVITVTLTGWARFTDVHIPLPGMGRVNTVEVDVSADIPFVAG